MKGADSPFRRLSELPGDLLSALLSPRQRQPQEPVASCLGSCAASIDWAGVAHEAEAQQVAVLVDVRLGELGGTRYLDPARAAAWSANARHAQLQCALQRRSALEITRALTRHGIRHAFLKGLVYREWLYRPTWARPGADLDVLIDRAAIEPARRVLHEIGFVHASRSPDFRDFRRATREEVRRTEESHYELAQLAKSYRLDNPPEWLFEPAFERPAPFAFESLPEGPVLHSVVDVHWALHFALAHESPLDDLGSLPLADDGAAVPTLSLEWHLVFALFKLYFEAFDRPGHSLHKLVDLAALLAAADSADWQLVRWLVNRNGMHAAAFYTLSAAQRLIGRTVVPARILEEWSRIEHDDRLPPEARHRDFGDFVPSMLGRRLPADFPARPTADR